MKKKQLVILKEDIPEHNLKTGTMGLVESQYEKNVDIIFFEGTSKNDKNFKTIKCNKINKNKLIKIEDFYTDKRLKSDSIWLKIALCLYFPLGLLLAIFRVSLLFVILIFAIFLPFLKNNSKFVVFCSYIAGIIPVFENKEEFYKSDAKTVVVNHVSLSDHTVFQSFNKIYFLSNRLEQQNLIYKIFYPILRGNVILLDKEESVNQLQERIKKALQKEPHAKLAIFPEGTVHNGNYLHYFHSFAFSLGDSILPATLKITSVFPVYYYPFTKGQIISTLLIPFLPFSIYHCKLLPTVYRKQGETDKEFAYRVQKLMAKDLNIIGTNVTDKHKKIYKKNREFYRALID
jgi:1-acyl-sn-glycerol-3-phosphate acyltransferase